MAYQMCVSKNTRIKEMYKLQKSFFWDADEIVFINDADDYRNLSKQEQDSLYRLLLFVSHADSIFANDLGTRARDSRLEEEFYRFFTIQEAIENIHDEAYTKMAQSILPISTVLKVSNRDLFYESFPNTASLFVKLSCTDDLDHKYVISVILEGLVFPYIFDEFFSICKEGKLSGVASATEFIQRDEALHLEFILQTLYYVGYTGKDIMVSMIKDTCKALVADGFSEEKIKLYSRLLADKISNELNDGKAIDYELQNYDLLKEINEKIKRSLVIRTNFFERSNTAYKRNL